MVYAPFAKPGGKGPKGPPNIQQYLALDVDYQNAINDLVQNLGAFKTKNIGQRGDLRQDYLTTQRRLGEEKTKTRQEMEEEAAARGMMGSGLYFKDVNDTMREFLEQSGDARTSFTRNKGQLLTDLADQRRLTQQLKQDAKLAAIRRRAAEYGIT